MTHNVFTNSCTTFARLCTCALVCTRDIVTVGTRHFLFFLHTRESEAHNFHLTTLKRPTDIHCTGYTAYIHRTRKQYTLTATQNSYHLWEYRGAYIVTGRASPETRHLSYRHHSSLWTSGRVYTTYPSSHSLSLSFSFSDLIHRKDRVEGVVWHCPFAITFSVLQHTRISLIDAERR